MRKRRIGFDVPYYWSHNKTGTIGDWGKGSLYWPDLIYRYSGDTTTINNRRYGGNFNFGAMGNSAGMDIPDMVGVAQLLALVGSRFTHLHPPAEQLAIEAGFYWWAEGSSRAPLVDGSTISIYIPYEDSL